MRPCSKVRTRKAMTLVEIILVFALIAAMLAIATPQLAGFFRGRALVEEARRFLALTRQARSEAASSALPMRLWIDTEAGQYGLEPQPGYESLSTGEVLRYRVADGLELHEVDDDRRTGVGDHPAIVFRPDGLLDERSLRSLRIEDGIRGDALTIALDNSGLFRIEEAVE